ncbi:MAG: single-stranded DNA-binding protein [Oscillospiraceae bacterium]|nr:single-stranded DNA-binding protein [Oscillospiraceae bacterium]
MEQFTNRIVLRGDLLGLPEFSHENHGRKFYRLFLEVPRLSGAIDTLPVVAELSLLEGLDLIHGERMTVEGQIRSHNHTDETGRHLMIFVFANGVAMEEGEPINDVSLEGLLCREPTFRRTPLGREICDAMLAVPRAFRRADYLPCILWGRTAQEISRCAIRDRISVRGRLQSRIYTKYQNDVPTERTAYEISALTAAPVVES